jgi:dGTPase
MIINKPEDRFYNFKKDFRSPYSRDRDKVIHSSSFRRLEYKTQVFINSDGDYFRTRLTHSIEVSQIARTISKELNLNDSLAEVIALSHDLGHTPFGHVGGEQLDKRLKNDGFINGFEHNFQSFRVVTSLEKRYKEFDGLNLTYATLEGILKHSLPYNKSFLPKRIVELFNLDYHPSLEAIVVDFSDEIAYISADIDDGIKYKLIDYNDLIENDIILNILQKVKKEGIKKNQKLFRNRFIALLISELVYQFLSFSSNNSYNTNKIHYKSLKSDDKLEFGYSPNFHKELKKLKKLLYQKLYKHHHITRKMHFGEIVIDGLYKAITSDNRILPINILQENKKRKLHRKIADYIANMSDRYAIKLYHELYG